MASNVDSLNLVFSTKGTPLISKPDVKGNIEVFENDKIESNIDELDVSTKNSRVNPEEKIDNKKKWLIAAGITLGTIALGVAGYYLFKNVKWFNNLGKLKNVEINKGNLANKAFKSSETLSVVNSLGKEVGTATKPDFIKSKFAIKHKFVSFFHKDVLVTLTERTALDTAVDIETLRRLPGYVDDKGEALPYLFIEGLKVHEKGKGNGRKVLSEIIQLAKEKYGGRLLLKPENRDCNPSIFYYKSGFLSTTDKGAKEIKDFLERGIPFKSGYSDAMYLPIS